jgi:23S rRNA (guanosine2251-2'-O)-methyltransferase
MAVTKFPYVVILDNIRSALNVGAIFRTCDGAGVSKLYLCGITPYPPHNRIPKTALGAVEFVNWERRTSTLELITELKSAGYQIWAIEQAPTTESYFTQNPPQKLALIFGNEISGVDPQVLATCDKVIEIPMFGQKNSLNVATTVGIITYHCAQNYAKK